MEEEISKRGGTDAFKVGPVVFGSDSGQDVEFSGKASRPPVSEPAGGPSEGIEGLGRGERQGAAWEKTPAGAGPSRRTVASSTAGKLERPQGKPTGGGPCLGNLRLPEKIKLNGWAWGTTETCGAHVSFSRDCVGGRFFRGFHGPVVAGLVLVVGRGGAGGTVELPPRRRHRKVGRGRGRSRPPVLEGAYRG